jgi:hypothetical protein
MPGALFLEVGGCLDGIVGRVPVPFCSSIISKAVPDKQARMSRLTVIHIRSNLEVAHDLATAQRLHELLEASRLWLSASLLGYLGVRGRYMVGRLSLGQGL